MADNRRAWTGWIVFAGIMLLVTGMLNIVEGFVALFYDERLVVDEGRLVVVDLTGWGWALLVSGVVLVAVGAGVLSGRTWGRILAIVAVGLHAITQLAWLAAYPVWSLLMIALDVTLLFALTARWSAAVDEPDGYDAAASDGSARRTAAPYPAASNAPPQNPDQPASSPSVVRSRARHMAG